MPRYELALILKAMQRTETAAAMRRTVEALLKHGAVVRNLENLGERSLPYKMSKHNLRHTSGGHSYSFTNGCAKCVKLMVPCTTKAAETAHRSATVEQWLVLLLHSTRFPGPPSDQRKIMPVDTLID
ncbi:small ribosomal subunit protein bS6m [Scyliorhinus torazame]|uniref:small ribosomal subunit protein bS6m n=1 Tax=Scyliorhinus torazame TaxID=75743 RepID=UPI003B5A2782